MELKVVIDKKFAFMILGGILILAGAIYGYAFGGSEPEIMGHNIGEIAWNEEISANVGIWANPSNAELKIGDGLGEGILELKGWEDETLTSIGRQGFGIIGPINRNVYIEIDGNGAEDSFSVVTDPDNSGGPDYEAFRVKNNGEICLGTDCIGSWPSGGGTDTNAETICTGNTFLDGNGVCKTADDIVSDGGGAVCTWASVTYSSNSYCSTACTYGGGGYTATYFRCVSTGYWAGPYTGGGVGCPVVCGS